MTAAAPPTIAQPIRGSVPRTWGSLAAVAILAVCSVLANPTAAARAAARSDASSVQTVALLPLRNSSVRGRATLESRGEVTLVTVVLESASNDGAYLVNLRQGTCSSYAPLPEAPLGEATVGSPLETAVDIALTDLDAGWVIAVHRTGDLSELLDPTRAVACGRVAERSHSAPMATATPKPDNAAVPVTGAGPLPGGTAARAWLEPAALAVAGVMAALAISLRWPAHRSPRPGSGPSP